MKTIILSITASLLVLGLGLSPFAVTGATTGAPVIEATGEPILLARMVVTATPLPDQPGLI